MVDMEPRVVECLPAQRRGMVYCTAALTPLFSEAFNVLQKIRLAYIPEPFKSARSTLLFFKPRKWPPIDKQIFIPLRKAFEALSEDPTKSIAFHEVPYIQMLGNFELRARSPSGKLCEYNRKGIVRLDITVKPVFDWVCPADEWRRFADLITALNGGHQYLICSPQEDAVVMVSDGEYFDEDFASVAMK